MMANLEKFKDHFILLCEAGFIAVNQADEDAAVKLFKASQLLNPKNTLPKIGIGYMHMMKLELKQASNLFDQVLALEPQNEMARAFLGISYALTATEMGKGEKILSESAKESSDPAIKQLANSAIDFLESFIKKDANPMQGPGQGPGVKKEKKKPKEKKHP
jgi:Flp pilus assembly protein TadD